MLGCQTTRKFRRLRAVFDPVSRHQTPMQPCKNSRAAMCACERFAAGSGHTLQRCRLTVGERRP